MAEAARLKNLVAACAMQRILRLARLYYPILSQVPPALRLYSPREVSTVFLLLSPSAQGLVTWPCFHHVQSVLTFLDWRKTNNRQQVVHEYAGLEVF